jgi:hypothetical protein
MAGKKVLLAAVLVTALAATTALGADFRFGGDMHFWLFDQSIGGGNISTRDSLGTPTTTAYDTTGRMTMAIHALYLAFSVQLSDRFSVTIEPEFGISTGATPSLGRKLGTQQGSGSYRAFDLHTAYVSTLLPWDVELNAGMLRPAFTEDFGERKAFQEHHRIGKSMTGTNAWHDFGVELYKSLEPTDGLSIPTYIYVLNGNNTLSDGNSNKWLMAHIAPQFWKLRLLGSYGFGKDDAEEMYASSRMAVGLGGTFGPVWFRTEYVASSYDGYEGYATPTSDPVIFAREPTGYYVKLGWNLVPDKFGLVLSYDNYSQNYTSFSTLGYTGGTAGLSTTEVGQELTTIAATGQYWITPGAAVLLTADKAMWKVGDGSVTDLDFMRFTLGGRIVF